MIQLARTEDERLIIASNQEFPSHVRRVEYFRDLKLLMLVFQDGEDGSDLMPCEISENAAGYITDSSSVIILPITQEKTNTKGYQVPLVQIGV